ncbi:unknown similar to AMEV226 [Adoxophyes honmai entomopoxvirus 'L']|uniref:Uncharacterized protein n=1 Tax=Adoxophyes honmai entomopoxvirus 'L' TaxID=1293540 RepID=A0A916KPP6_9POXV|nr:unknown similar to AMEV226 [Adoxophyes honmai entomopoxvirus 'L']CCU55525.1 unknown similar to AMEV226 [Adoxophyes honmai entomopoxvirus 'L']
MNHIENIENSNNIFYLSCVYNNYKKQIKNKKLLKKFNKLYKSHTEIINILKYNNTYYDELKEIDKKIYCNIYLLKLKYGLMLEKNIINILGYVTIITHIMNTFYNYNIDNNIFLKSIFNNISGDDDNYIEYINNYRMYTIHIIDTVLDNNIEHDLTKYRVIK